MSKIVASAAIRGAKTLVSESEKLVNKAIEEKGKNQKIEFPETGFFLPMANALLAAEVKTLNDTLPVLKEAKSLLHDEPTEKLWLPYLGDALDSGIATLLAEEIICAIRYLYGKEPQPDCVGFYTDTWMRSYGIQLVDGRMPGFAAILGAAPDNKTAVEIVREFQKRNIMTFVGSSSNGKSIIDQLKEEKVEMGWDTYIVPYGRDTITGIYPLSWAIRSALTFGGIKPGEAKECLLYCKERVFAFGLTFGPLDDIKYATGAGAINMGFPIIADTDIPEIKPTGICIYEHLVKEFDYKKIIQKCIEVRGVKVRISEIPIPVAYSAAFEGERVRREQMYVQFGGKFSSAFEFVRSKTLGEIEDGKIDVVGPEIDDMKEGSAYPLGILVEVAGRKMQADFEPILERQVHTFLNEAMGIFHMGQRNMCWIRISKEAHKKGFKIKHFGTIIHARLHDTYGKIVDKAQITIYTTKEDVDKIMPEAVASYEKRDARIAGMTDESVDTFYSCTLCVPKGELIVFADGSFKNIENLIENAVDGEKVNVLSLDRAKLVSKPVQELFLNPAPRSLAKIMLTNNDSIRLTFNHKVLVDRPDGLIWIQARELRTGDYLISSKITNIDENCWRKEDPPYIINFLPDEMKIFDDEFLKFLKKLILQKYGTLREAAKELKIDYDRLCKALSRRESSKQNRSRPRFKIGELMQIVAMLELNWAEIKKHIRVFGTNRPQRLEKVTIDEDLMYTVGLIASDGCVIKAGHSSQVIFTNSEHSLIDSYEKIIFETFKIKPRIFLINRPLINLVNNTQVFSKRKVFGAVTSNPIITRFLSRLGIRPKDRTEKWHGEVISTLPSKLVAAFLKGLFDGDGHVTKTHLFVSTGRYKEAQHILLLLKKLGIHSYITATTRGFQVGTRSFIDYMNFRFLISSNHPSKRAKMMAAKFTFDRNHVVRRDIIPLKCGQLIDNLICRYGDKIEITKLAVDYKSIEAWRKGKRRASKEKLKLFLGSLNKVVPNEDDDYQELLKWSDSNVAFEKVKKIEKLSYGEKTVYNFSVQGTHNYMVRNLIVSNCQSFAPNHVCIVKPERIGLCGAYSHIDAKACYELNPAGPNQPVKKGEVLDPVRGEWKGVNDFIYQKSNKTLERFHGYSLMTFPETSCGCFECIIAILPEANGFMIVNREYSGFTPAGMKFSTLAGSVGGGNQTPGFMGIGKLYIVSKKFIAADGGIKRLVWMPKELKETLGDKLKKRCEEEGVPDLFDKIADESVAVEPEELLKFLQEKNHPAFTMPPLM